MTTWANPRDIEAAAERWTDAQVACRTYGHNWQPQSVRHSLGVFHVLQRCGRCRNGRRQEVNEQGYPLTPWQMSYQEGYLLRGVGRIGSDGRAVLRLAVIRKSYVEEVD